MCLLPRATLHSDSEQFIYNLDAGRRPGPGLRKPEGSQGDERKSGQTKGIYANQVVMWIHANQGHCYANQVAMWIRAN